MHHEPIPQPRPRAVTRGRYTTIVSQFHGHPVVPYKAAAAYEARRAMAALDARPIDSDICLQLLFVMPRPSRLVWKTKPMPRMPHVSTPDLDNLIKSVLDAWNGILWTDDARICELRACKVIAAGDEQPHVEAVLWRRSSAG